MSTRLSSSSKYSIKSDLPCLVRGLLSTATEVLTTLAWSLASLSVSVSTAVIAPVAQITQRRKFFFLTHYHSKLLLVTMMMGVPWSLVSYWVSTPGPPNRRLPSRVPRLRNSSPRGQNLPLLSLTSLIHSSMTRSLSSSLSTPVLVLVSNREMYLEHHLKFVHIFAHMFARANI